MIGYVFNLNKCVFSNFIRLKFFLKNVLQFQELSSDNKFNNKKSYRNRKRSAEASITEDDDEENNDWWTKYFASLESAAEVIG